MAPRVRATSGLQLGHFTQAILQAGGEGIVARKPNSKFEQGRSTNLLKWKASRLDMEALVAGVEPDSFLLQLYHSFSFSFLFLFSFLFFPISFPFPFFSSFSFISFLCLSFYSSFFSLITKGLMG